MPNLTIKFPYSEISSLFSRYCYATDPTPLVDAKSIVKASGHLTKAQMVAVARWKAPRAAPKVEKNTESLVIEASRIAMSCSEEELRIKVLTLLHGVSYPMASVVLHWFHSAPYPIIDYRALWSLGVDDVKQSDYTFDFWWSYVIACRKLSFEANVDMRTLDCALWQFSKENQPPRSRQSLAATET